MQDIQFGAKLGMNVSNVTGDLEDAKSLIGLHFGGFAEISITDKFAVQPELLFSMQGAKSEYFESENNYSYSEKSTIKLNYLNVPVLAKYYITDKFSVLAGPQIGFLLSAKDKYDYSETLFGDTESFSDTEDVKDFYESIALSFNLGGSYSFTDKIFVDARYNMGLSNISKDYTDEFGDNYSLDQKNNVIQVSIGYKF